MSYFFNRPPQHYTVGIKEFNPETKETDVDQFDFFIDWKKQTAKVVKMESHENDSDTAA